MAHCKNIILSIALLLHACAVVPSNLADNNQDVDSQFSRTVVATTSLDRAAQNTQPITALSNQIRISSGDMLRIKVVGLEEFDGLYQVNHAGAIELPYLDEVNVFGLNRTQAIELLKTTLIKQNWLYKEMALVELTLVRLAPIKVAVTGAVFSPGSVAINHQPKEKAEDVIQQQAGVFASGRDLFSALRSAGGIRPDAELSEVYLKRDNQMYRINLTGLLSGEYIDAPTLIQGDQVYVGSSGIEKADYIRPSQITPPGMRVLMSNLTAPALSNAQSNIGNDSSRLPYGITLIDAAVSANCVGGTHNANASRSLVLITHNYGANTPVVIKRSINQLLRSANDKKVNPYVMPNDAIACYDSRFTNFRDVARGLGELINPFILGRIL